MSSTLFSIFFFNSLFCLLFLCSRKKIRGLISSFKVLNVEQKNLLNAENLYQIGLKFMIFYDIICFQTFFRSFSFFCFFKTILYF